MQATAKDEPWWRKALIRLRLDPESPSTFSSERSFNPPIGQHWGPREQVRGYYIDFSFKAKAPRWPPYWLEPVERQLHVATAQWGVGAYERYLKGEGEDWLEGARGAADHLLEHQHSGGGQDGGWRHLFPSFHTFRLQPPWLSAMAQGEGASLLVRLHLETGEERYAEGALRALRPMNVAVTEGGTLTYLDGVPFVEEYPTDRPSCVLNGAIFALWGYYDVSRALSDPGAAGAFESLVSALATSMPRYDTGYWSRYDLYPHPVANIASPAYHLLHIKQLRILARLAPKPEFESAVSRFEAYRASRTCRYRALSKKIAFRLAVPRNSLLAHRLPWNRRQRTISNT
jgi:heparosan-N-sulfate-glucuronate 5-epimerase